MTVLVLCCSAKSPNKMNQQCRLCRLDKDLIYMFDETRLKDLNMIRYIVWLGTGVKFQENDASSNMICRACCEIVLKLMKYRVTAMNNDKKLKEQLGLPYTPPACNPNEIFSKSTTFVENMMNILDTNASTCDSNNDDHSSTSTNYSKTGKKLYQHPSVKKLYDCYENIIIPEDVYRSDIAPVISLDSDEVTEWFEEYATKMEMPSSNIKSEPVQQVSSNKNLRNTSKRSSRNFDNEIEEEIIPQKKIRVFKGENNLSNYPPELNSTQKLDTHMPTLFRSPRLRNKQKIEPVENIIPTSTRTSRVNSKQNILENTPGSSVKTSTRISTTPTQIPPTSNNVANRKVNDSKEHLDSISTPSNALKGSKKDTKIKNAVDTFCMCEPDRLQNYFKSVREYVPNEDVFNFLWDIDKNKTAPTVVNSSQTYSFIPKDQIKYPENNSVLLTNLRKELDQHQVPIYFQDNVKFEADFKKRIISSKSKILVDWSDKEVKINRIKTSLYPNCPIFI